MDTTRTPRTILEAIRHFSNPDVCIAYVVERRWPHGVTCPTCGNPEVSYITTRRMWQCKARHPKRQFSVKVGTIFEDSPLPLEKWLPAMWMIANHKNGVSSYEIHRALGVTQKTAWHMGHRIRLAMQNRSLSKMSGEVEADETFIGGLAKFMHKERRERTIKGTGGAGKAAVMGLLERHGPDKHSRVYASVVPNTQKDTLHAKVRQHVKSGSEMFTDAYISYRGLDDKAEYIHQVIDHAEAYAKGRVHTNGLENFWSLLKRAIKGTYVSVEPFHLDRYVDEQAYRFNRRQTDDGDRFSKLVASVFGRRLTYKDLIGATLPEPSLA